MGKDILHLSSWVFPRELQFYTQQKKTNAKIIVDTNTSIFFFSFLGTL